MESLCTRFHLLGKTFPAWFLRTKYFKIFSMAWPDNTPISYISFILSESKARRGRLTWAPASEPHENPWKAYPLQKLETWTYSTDLFP